MKHVSRREFCVYLALLLTGGTSAEVIERATPIGLQSVLNTWKNEREGFERQVSDMKALFPAIRNFAYKGVKGSGD